MAVHQPGAEPTASEYLDATRQYRADLHLGGYMASTLAEMLTPEQRARVIAIMREEEFRAAVQS